MFNVKKASVNQELKLQFDKVENLEKDAEDLINKFRVEEPATEYGKVAGFDIVIGNLPYGALFSKPELDYFKIRFTTAVWRCESYLLFIEQALKLLKPHGKIGFIIPDTLLNLGFTQPARELLLRNSKIEEIVGLPSTVFSGATVDTIILFADKKDYTNKFHSSNVVIKTFGKKQTITAIEDAQKQFLISTKDWYDQNAFNLQTNEVEKKLLDKIEVNKKRIADVAEMYSGIKAYSVGRGTPIQTEEIRNSKPYNSPVRKDNTWSPFYDGKNIGRYINLWANNNWIKYGSNLAEPRKPENFKGEKILIRKITGKTLIAMFIPGDSYCNTLLHVLKLKEKSYSYKTILAILNSQMIGWYFRKKFQISDDDTFPQIMIRDILQFPVPVISKKYHEELNNLADQLLTLNQERQQQTLQIRIDQIQNRIDYAEQRINDIVYELYRMNEDEKKLIEAQ